MKLDICGGDSPLPGYTSVDIVDYPCTDVVTDILEPLPFPDDSIEEIWSCATIEHFSYRNAMKILKEFYRILALGSFVTIAVPDLDNIIKAYYENTADKVYLINMLYGEQVNEFHVHKWCWTKPALIKALLGTGFKEAFSVPYSYFRHRPQTGCMLQIKAIK